MPRSVRICPKDVPQHIVQRGNNRQACFAEKEDYAAFANWLNEAAKNYQVDIHAWVLMTNHVHLLATPRVDNALSSMMQSLGRQYVRYFNNKYKRSGTLWEGRYKSVVIDSEYYLLSCQRYIELNPVRAKMVSEPEDYPWSSVHAHLGRSKPELWTPHPTFFALGATKDERMSAYRTFLKAAPGKDEFQNIRNATKSERALGTKRFVKQIEILTGQRQTPLKRGRKKKLGSE